MVGLVSGWISATIGFAAPTALAAITFGTCLASVFPSLSPTWLGAGLVIALTGVHATTYRRSSLFQRSFTTVKVALILAFRVAAVVLADPPQPVSLLPAPGDGALVFSGAFAVSLIYVSYAYTGWNAATYLTGEVTNPQRTLPRVLGGGTLLVMVLYVGLNYAFLRAAPMEAMEGRIEVGYVAATHLFGPAGAAIMGVTLAVLLVSTVSAMVMAGAPCAAGDRRGLPPVPVPQPHQSGRHSGGRDRDRGRAHPGVHPHSVVYLIAGRGSSSAWFREARVIPRSPPARYRR